MRVSLKPFNFTSVAATAAVTFAWSAIPVSAQSMIKITDISNVFLPIEKKEEEFCQEKRIEYVALPVTHDGLSVAVNPQNDTTPEQVLGPIAGRLGRSNGSRVFQDLIGLQRLIVNDGETFESLTTGANPVVIFTDPVAGTTRAITQAEFDAVIAPTEAELLAIIMANHPFNEWLGNLYQLSDDAPYPNDLRGFYDAHVVDGATFADLTVGVQAARIDTDGDGMGDRTMSQSEFVMLQSLSNAVVNALMDV